MRPRSRVETGPEYLHAQRNGQNCLLFTYQLVEFAGAIHNKSEERELVVDSGASMHIVSRKDLNSPELGAVMVF